MLVLRWDLLSATNIGFDRTICRVWWDQVGQLTSITRPDQKPFKSQCSILVRNFPVALFSFPPLNHRLWFSRSEVLQWLSSPPSPGRPFQSLESILRLGGLLCSSRLLSKSLRRSVLLKRPVTLFKKFWPQVPLVYLFPVSVRDRSNGQRAPVSALGVTRSGRRYIKPPPPSQ